MLDDACTVLGPLTAVQDDAKSRLESGNMVLESSASPAAEKLISSKRFMSSEGSFSDWPETEATGKNSP